MWPRERQLFRHHADETREQIEKLKRVFALLEISEYQALIASVGSSEPEAARLLQENLEQETHTNEELLSHLESLSA